MLLDAVYPPDPRVENEAVSLIEAGHEVYLFCLHYGDQPEEEGIKGIYVKRYKSSRLEFKLSALAYTVPFYKISLSKKIENFVENHKVEVLHVHDMRMAGAAFKANQPYGLPIHLDLHENRPEIMKFYPHLNKFPGKYIIQPSTWKKFEKHYVQQATNVITVTEEAKNELVLRCSVSENKIISVPNTVHKNFYENANFDIGIEKKFKDDFVLLYLGDTGLRRGLLTAIESVAQLKIEIPNIKLVIVGTSTEDSILKEKISELGIENFVSFEGWQNVELFPSYIKASNICISPLHRNKHHDTTYANKIFQYMAFSKVILASNATSQENIIHKSNAGLIHKAEDVDDFSDKVRMLYADEEMCASFGKNGQKFIQNEFTWEHTSKNLINLYNNLDS